MTWPFDRRRRDTDLDDELQAHFRLAVRERIEAGTPPADAEAAARREFGNLLRTREQVRDAWGWSWLEQLGQDAAYACRSLTRSPGVTVPVLLMLALGLGANAAMYGLLNRLFLQPPPHIENPEGVYRVYLRTTGRGEATRTTTFIQWDEFKALAEDSRFSAVAGYRPPAAALNGKGQSAEELQVSWVTGNFFDLLGVRAARGRLIAPSDDDLKAPPVAVAGDGYARRRFGSARDALGQTVTFESVTYTIAGVTPAGFSGPDTTAADVWLPVHHAAEASRPGNWQRFGSGFSLPPLARLAPGVTPEAAAEATTGVLRRVREASPLFRSIAATVVLGPILEGRGPAALTADLHLPLVVGGMAALVFLIAMANVANLLMLRMVTRRRELVVRAALGAERWRIGRLLVIESLVLALVSAAGALAVTAMAGRILRATLLPDYHWASDPIDGQVLLFACASAIAVGVLTGLIPAVQASRLGAPEVLRGNTRTSRASRSWVRSGLLVLQSALSVVLLAGAAVFYQSFDAARRLDIGYARDNLLTIDVGDFGFRGRPAPLDEPAVRRLEQRVRALPDVRDVAHSTNTPLGGHLAIPMRVRGMPKLPGMNGPYVSFVSTNFFDVAGLHVFRGRGFTKADHERAPKVAVVNSALARIVWPSGNPIGECLFVGTKPVDCATVVGVVEAGREFGLDEASALPQYFVPLPQALADTATANIPRRQRTLIVRTTGDPGRIVQPALVTLGELFPDLPRDRVTSLPEKFAPRIRTWKVGTGLFAAAAALAVLLAAIGLYAVIAFGVRQREFEFGIRRALGAQAGHLIRLVMARGVALAVAGVTLGTLASLWSARFVAPLLFENRSPRDPKALALATGVLLMAAMAASFIPARRAATIDPRHSLQAE
jgi:predicted permease